MSKVVCFCNGLSILGGIKKDFHLICRIINIIQVKHLGVCETVRLKEIFLNLGIKSKILIFFYCIIIIVSLILGFYSYLTSVRFVINRVSQSNLALVKQVSNNVEFLQNDIMDISTYLCLDSGVQSFLKATGAILEPNGPNPSDSLIISLNESLRFLNQLLATKSYVSCIILYNRNGVPVFFTSTDLSIGKDSVLSTEEVKIYEQARQLKGSPVWFTINNKHPLFMEKSLYPKIALGRIIRNTNSSAEIGFLIICINEQTLKNMYMGNLTSHEEGILVIDRNDNVISQQPGLLPVEEYKGARKRIRERYGAIGSGYITQKSKQDDILVAYSDVNATGWQIFYSMPLNMATKEIHSIKGFTLLVIFICVLLTTPLIIMISSYLTAPIKKLYRSMKKFQEGNFDEKVNFKYNDEIGILGQGYDNMVVNIKQLIDNNYILQIKEREAELNALQAQINPHFLYNTLEAIHWEAVEAGQNNISEMVINLSRLFRLSLNRGKSFTLVSKERDLIEYYLNLQKMRLKEKLNFRISIREGILNYIIPKLILQPFVENAVLHGIGKKASGGNLEVTGMLFENKLLFTIRDDGIGMDSGTIAALFKEKEQGDVNTSETPGGYAVHNVDERLKLYYKEDYSLTFQSGYGSGTTVEIAIPANKGSEEGSL